MYDQFVLKNGSFLTLFFSRFSDLFNIFINLSIIFTLTNYEVIIAELVQLKKLNVKQNKNMFAGAAGNLRL